MSKGTVWITRSLPAAEKSARAWKSAGYKTLIEPLVDIAPPKEMPSPPQPNAILLVTSSNALRFLAALTDLRNWTVMSVGNATAQAAKELGFVKVISAAGDAQDLISLVKKHYQPSDNRSFDYISGSDVRTDIAAVLTAAEFRARRQIYYQNTPRPVSRDFDFSAVTHVALYSAMAANALCPYLDQVQNAHICSISAAVDGVVKSHPQHHRRIADHPNEPAMIKAML